METSSRRSALAFGLGLGGLLGLVGRAAGQQGSRDNNVRPARNGNVGAAGAPPAIPAPVIATIDPNAVMAGYAKVKAVGESFKQYQASRMKELTKLEAEGKDYETEIQKFAPNSPDFKKYEEKLTLIKAKLAAGEEQYKRDVSQRYGESMATLLKEVQEITAYVARTRHITHVLKCSKEPINTADPSTLDAAVKMPLMWADPATDITADVIRVLNSQYQKAQAEVESAQPAPRDAAAPKSAKPAAAGRK